MKDITDHAKVMMGGVKVIESALTYMVHQFKAMYALMSQLAIYEHNRLNGGQTVSDNHGQQQTGDGSLFKQILRWFQQVMSGFFDLL